MPPLRAAALLACALLGGAACRDAAAPPPLAEQRGTVQPRRVDFDPDDRDRLLVIEADGRVQIWLVRDPAHPTAIVDVAAAAMDARFAGGAHGFAVGDRSGGVALRDAAGALLWQAAERHPGGVRAVAAAADRIVSGGADGVIRVRDLAGRERHEPLRGGGAILAVALAPDARTLVAESADTRLRLWRLSANGTPRLVRDPAERYVRMLPNLLQLDAQWGWDRSLAFAPAGDWFAAADLDGSVTVWDLDARPRAILAGAHRGHHVRAVAVAPRGDLIATAGFDGTLQLWSAAGGRRGAPLVGHRKMVSGVAFDAAGARLASASLDGTVRLWSAAGAALATLPRYGR